MKQTVAHEFRHFAEDAFDDQLTDQVKLRAEESALVPLGVIPVRHKGHCDFILEMAQLSLTVRSSPEGDAVGLTRRDSVQHFEHGSGSSHLRNPVERG